MDQGVQSRFGTEPKRLDQDPQLWFYSVSTTPTLSRTVDTGQDRLRYHLANICSSVSPLCSALSVCQLFFFFFLCGLWRTMCRIKFISFAISIWVSKKLYFKFISLNSICIIFFNYLLLTSFLVCWFYGWFSMLKLQVTVRSTT